MEECGQGPQRWQVGLDSSVGEPFAEAIGAPAAALVDLLVEGRNRGVWNRVAFNELIVLLLFYWEMPMTERAVPQRAWVSGARSCR